MNNEELDNWINLYLDNQLNQAQSELFEQTMADNSEIRQQYEQAMETDRILKKHLYQTKDDHDEHFRVILSQACDCLPDKVRPESSCGIIRFITGLAAGLLIGVSASFFYEHFRSGIHKTNLSNQIVDVKANSTFPTQKDVDPVPYTPSVSPVVRDIDWYLYTDDEGGQWVFESIRENRLNSDIQTVMY